jgi:hypothetical protein
VKEVIEHEDEANECEFSRNLRMDLEPPIPASGECRETCEVNICRCAVRPACPARKTPEFEHMCWP